MCQGPCNDCRRNQPLPPLASPTSTDVSARLPFVVKRKQSQTASPFFFLFLHFLCFCSHDLFFTFFYFTLRFLDKTKNDTFFCVCSPGEETPPSICLQSLHEVRIFFSILLVICTNACPKMLHVISYSSCDLDFREFFTVFLNSYA